MIKKGLYFITILLLTLLSFLVYDFISFKNEQDEVVLEKGQKITQELTNEIDLVLKNVISEAESLVALLHEKEYSKEEIEQLIGDHSIRMDEILGITVAYEPYAYNKNTELYSPYFDKNQNKIIRLEEKYDYTNSSLKTSQWYNQPKLNGAMWIEPYYGQAAKALISDYSIPFYHQTGTDKGEIKGVVALTISLKGFTKLIHDLSLGKTGLGFVCSKKGVLLAHPVKEYIGIKNIADILKEESEPKIKKAYQSILNYKKGHTEFYDEYKKETTLFFYDQVATSNWGIGVLFFKNDMLGGGNYFKKKYIHIAVTLSLLLFFLLAIFYNRDYLSVSEIWYLSLFASFILILNIMFIGYLEHTTKNILLTSETPPIIDNTSLSNFINQQNRKSIHMNIIPPVAVPTGMYVERLEFGDSYNLNISGQLWQKYDTLDLKNITPGFRFPQTAPFAESSFIEETHKDFMGDKVLIGYDFRTTVRLNFKYDSYPFDKRHISLEIQPKENTKNNILLIPDLKSYKNTNPSQKSGIDPNIQLPGSKIMESYFSYRTNSYSTNFGNEKKDEFQEYPVLHFNINVKRILITAFITYLIPIFVTLIMMFILIYATGKSKDNQTGGEIVQGMAAFFFVLIFSHIDLRKDILTADLVYMEYFYFIAYIMIILSTFNLITYTRTSNQLFDYKNNLIVKASFWPMFLFLSLLLTLIKFY
ncbi:cache domain-containing protein [Aquimarina addita]|uniref:Cache domain-containing protein n=1 Tax=Aquimarina addita TaxID=870485 RepID=A0ABP7X947_9FLAO